MSPRRANPELADRRREALVRAGYAEILEKGIPGVTLIRWLPGRHRARVVRSIISTLRKIFSPQCWNGFFGS